VPVPRLGALRARTPPALLAVAPDLQNGLRAAIATVGPFALAGVLHDDRLALAGLGGWLGTLVDPGGERAMRARVLVAFAIAGALALLLAHAASVTPWTSAIALGGVCFVTALARALGASGATTGTLLAIVFAVGTAQDGGAPLRDATYFALGAMQAVLLSSILWPIAHHGPLRHAVARVHRALSAYAEALRGCAQEDAPDGDPRWTRVAREQRPASRVAIEQARALAVATRARTTGATAIGSSLRVLLGIAESELALIVTLGERLEAADRAGRDAIDHALARAAENDRRVAHAVVARVAPPPTVEAPSVGVLARLAQLQREAREVAATLDHPRDGLPSLEHVAPADLRAALAALRDALSPSSIVLRHAVRVALAATVAGAVGQLAAPAHAHWVAITAIAVLQPYPGATWKRAVERVIGTVLGCVLALAITFGVEDPLALALIMFPLSVAAVATRARSYRLFTFFLTPVFVLVSERYPGDWHAAVERAGDAALGGLVAALAALIVFPSWERERIPDALAAAYDALASYARAIAGSWRGPRGPIDDARRASAAALAAAETSLERMLSEPRTDPEGASRALDAVTHARRLAGALTAIAQEQAAGTGTLEPLVAHLAGTLDALASAARARRPPPGLPEPPPLDARLDPVLRGHAEHALAYVARMHGASSVAAGAAP